MWFEPALSVTVESAVLPERLGIAASDAPTILEGKALAVYPEMERLDDREGLKEYFALISVFHGSDRPASGGMSSAGSQAGEERRRFNLARAILFQLLHTILDAEQARLRRVWRWMRARG
jgi:hypothetical protein